MALSLEELRLLLPDSSIKLDVSPSSRDSAIRSAGALLIEAGAVVPEYVDEMLERERVVSTFVGEGVAMPHGTLTAKADVLAEGLSLLRLKHPVDWNGHDVTLVIAIAAHGRNYISLLSRLATVLLEGGNLAAIRAAEGPEQIRTVLAGLARTLR